MIQSKELRDSSGTIVGVIETLEDVSEQRQAQEKMFRLNLVLGTIRNVNQLIFREKNRDVLIWEVCNILIERRGYTTAWIMLFDASGEFLSCAESGLRKGFTPLLKELKRSDFPACVQQALEQQSLLEITDPSSTCSGCPIADFYPHKGHMATIRLEYAGVVYGILAISVPLDFTVGEDEHALLEEIAGDIAFAMYNIQLEQRVIKRTAQLETANRELESFSYSVSHDLRTPLRAMSGYSRILVEEYEQQLPKEAQRYLGLVQENSHKMGRLIDDLLLFSCTGRQVLRIQDVNCVEIAERALAELQAEREDCEVEFNFGNSHDCYADPVLIKQVFINLLSNAFKFTKAKKNARVEVGSKIIKAEMVHFVKDNGVGFDMQYVDKLFSVFQRLHSTTEFEGTGVGLAIAHGIIQRHGGRIWAEAELDKGAIFYFTLGAKDE